MGLTGTLAEHPERWPSVTCTPPEPPRPTSPGWNDVAVSTSDCWPASLRRQPAVVHPRRPTDLRGST